VLLPLVSSTFCGNMTCNNNGTCQVNPINQGISCDVTGASVCTDTSTGVCTNGYCTASNFSDGTPCNNSVNINPANPCTTYQCMGGVCGLDANPGLVCSSDGNPLPPKILQFLFLLLDIFILFLQFLFYFLLFFLP